MKAGILTRLRIFFGRANRNDLINMFYDAKMRHDYKGVRDIGNKLVRLRKNGQPTEGSYNYYMGKYCQAIIDKDVQKAKRYHACLLEMDKALFKR